MKTKSKVTAFRNADVQGSIPPRYMTTNAVSPVMTSSIQPVLFNDEGKNINNSRNCGPKLLKDVDTDIGKLTHGFTVRSNEITWINRDPNGLNKHVAIQFEEVIGETRDIHSVTCCWRCAQCCYTGWKNFIYKLCTLFAAFPTSVFYGCWFGLNAFVLIWLLKPFSHFCHVCCEYCISDIIKQCTMCLIGIPCSAIGQIFSIFNKKLKKSQNSLGRRVPRVTFSDKVRTKRIPRNEEKKLTDSEKRVIFSRMPWQRRRF